MLKKIKRRRTQKKEAKRQKLYIIKNMPTAYDDAVLSWIAPETIKHERGTVWKVIMTLIILTTIVLGVLYNAWTFSLAVGVFAVVYYLVHLEHPKNVEVKLSDIGVKVGAKKFPYSQIKAFWILYDPPYVKTLNLRVSGEFITDLTVQLDGQSPAPVREFLMEKIPEMEGQTEKVSDIFLRLFKI